MDSSFAQPAAVTPSREAQGEKVAGFFIDLCLVVILAAAPLLAAGRGGETFVILSIIAVGGVITLYQRGSRAKRLARCAWLLFFAISVVIFLSVKALAPGSVAGDVARWAALGVKWALVAGLAGCAFKLVRARRGPRLNDAFDWGAALTIGVLLFSTATFVTAGDRIAASALATPCALLGMHFVVREQCQSLEKARRFTQFAMASAIVALAGWAFV